jgi:hypothetical protein
MNKKKHFTICLGILVLAALLSSASLNAQIYGRGWDVGTTISYTNVLRERSSAESTNDTLGQNLEFSAEAQFEINVTYVNELSEEARITETWADEHDSYAYNIEFNADYVSSDLASSLFYFYYIWDYNFNRELLQSFNMYLGDFYPIVNPDWDVFNTNFNATLDGDRVIAAIDTGYVLEYIYFSDFISEVSFLINGESTIAGARSSFTPARSSWKFSFDLKDYILRREYNYDDDIFEYYEYDNYDVIFELEYTKGGVLKKILSSEAYSITRDNVKLSYEEFYSIYSEDEGTASISYDLIPTMIVLILLPTLFLYKRKRR